MTDPRQRLSSMDKVRWTADRSQARQTPESSPTFKNNGAVRPKSKTKPKPFYERKTKRPTVGALQGLPMVGSETAQNQVRKESWRRVASLPPPGSSFNEKMLLDATRPRLSIRFPDIVNRQIRRHVSVLKSLPYNRFEGYNTRFHARDWFEDGKRP